MSFRPLHIRFVLATVLSLAISGCTSLPWRKQNTVTQQAKDAYFEQAATKIQYNDLAGNSSGYQNRAVAESTYSPARTVSPNPSIGSGSCH